MLAKQGFDCCIQSILLYTTSRTTNITKTIKSLKVTQVFVTLFFSEVTNKLVKSVYMKSCTYRKMDQPLVCALEVTFDLGGTPLILH